VDGGVRNQLPLSDFQMVIKMETGLAIVCTYGLGPLTSSNG